MLKCITRLFIGLSSTFFVFNTYAQSLSQTHGIPNAHWFPAEIIKVIDGDTVKVKLTLYPNLYQEVNVRFAGVDAPESRRGKKNGTAIPECEIALGKQVKQYVGETLADVSKIWVKQDIGQKGKYAGRMVGEIWYQQSQDSISLSEHLLHLGMVKPYHGGNRDVWDCEKGFAPAHAGGAKAKRLALKQVAEF